MTDFGTGYIVQQVFKTERGAISSASRHGGHVERVALDYYGNPDIVMR